MARHECVLEYRRAERQDRRQGSPPRVTALRRAAEDLLRELAFVYHATRAVRQAMTPVRSA